ncbi:MAG: pyrroline-5-carboxylate reductase [Actinomycetes bacterium]
MEQASLTIIGGGNMGAALAHGLLRAGLAPNMLTIVEVSPDQRKVLGSAFPDVHIEESVQKCNAAVIAVKPPDAAQATSLAAQAGARTVLSIAAGVSLATLQNAAGNDVAVIRAMPNTPSLVGEGAAGYALGVSCTENSEKFAVEVLGSVGIAVRVQEDQIDAITGLTGSGPAYLFYIAESLMAAAQEMGIDAELADPLVRQLLRGSGVLLAQSTESPAQLRERVTSPGGTTAAGLASLRASGVSEAIVAAVRAATQRSREMGQEAQK